MTVSYISTIKMIVIWYFYWHVSEASGKKYKRNQRVYCNSLEKKFWHLIMFIKLSINSVLTPQINPFYVPMVVYNFSFLLFPYLSQFVTYHDNNILFKSQIKPLTPPFKGLWKHFLFVCEMGQIGSYECC